VKQYKEECEIVMHKLTRIAKIVVNVGKSCENHNLSEEDLPARLRAILDSLQKFVSAVTVILPGPYDLTKDQRIG
jgi:predicted transcriptional regulator YheO